MKCPECQFDNRESAKFCNECGYKFDLTCPECGATNRVGSKFCDECGHDLGELTEAPEIDFNQPQSYTPKFLADKILKNRSSIEGERKLVTVLFADVADYTSMAEKFDPEEVHQIMDGCFRILMDEIHRYEGTINQFTGDGVMALFGAPVAHENHAQRACYSALAIQQAIGEYGEKLKDECGMDFLMRIGLNSGTVVVGSVGDNLRMDYTAVGDVTNLASRMESAANPGHVLISKNTYRLVKDYFEFETLSKIEMKGKKEPQEAYKLLRTSQIDTRFRASVAKGLTRFVGRKKSMPALMEVYDKAMGGSGQVVGIVGEAGVGKSRLLLEFRNRTIQDRYTYLEGRSLHYGGSMPYLPMLDVIRSYFDIKEGDREFIIKQKIKDKILSLDEKLKNVILPIHDLLSLKVDDEQFNKLEPQKKREKTFEAIRDLLIRMSQEKPLIVAIEDLHWIDKTTEEFLDYLIGWLTSTPILLILLYRPEYTHQWGSKSYYNRIGLDQLTTLSSAELIKAILEEGEVTPELRELVLNRTAGNPLFVEEFTLSLLENGSIERKDKKYVLSGKASDIHVPDTIQGIIAARMDRLEDNLKRTMQVASVIGRDFAFRILQTIIGMREELKSHLLNLQGLEFIYEKSLFPELEYIFKHAMTQEVAYDSLLAKRRKEVHKRIGEAIEQIYAERLEEFYEMLAYHFDCGEVWDKALFYLRLAGSKAAERSALPDARAWFEQALSVLEVLPASQSTLEQAFEIRFELRTVLTQLGEFRPALERLREAETLSEQLNDDHRRARVCSVLMTLHTLLGEMDEAVATGTRALEMARRLGDLRLQILTTSYLEQAQYYRGEYERVVDLATDALTILPADWVYEHFGMVAPASVYARAWLIISLAELGRFGEAAEHAAEAIRLAEPTQHAYTIGLAHRAAGTLCLLKGDWAKARSLLEHGIAVLRTGNVLLSLTPTVAGSAWALAQLGEASEALNRLREGEHAVEGRVVRGMRHGWDYHQLGRTCLLLGRLDEAQRLGELAVELLSYEPGGAAHAMHLLGEIVTHPDRFDAECGEAYYRKALAAAEPRGMRPLVAHCHLGLCKLYRRTGDREKAKEHLTSAAALYREMGMTFWLKKTETAMTELT
jgi:class 3 adenylate cyclase/tetratricopeptide (TPR) repeat protein